MQVENSEIMFCPGCPAAQLFLDTVDQDSADYVVEVPFNPGESVKTRLSFTDRDGQTSGNFSYSLGKLHEFAREYDLPMNLLKSGWVRNPKTVERAAEKLLQPVTDQMINRIGRCGVEGVRRDSQIKCPAFNSDALKSITELVLHPEEE